MQITWHFADTFTDAFEQILFRQMLFQTDTLQTDTPQADTFAITTIKLLTKPVNFTEWRTFTGRGHFED